MRAKTEFMRVICANMLCAGNPGPYHPTNRPTSIGRGALCGANRGLRPPERAPPEP